MRCEVKDADDTLFLEQCQKPHSSPKRIPRCTRQFGHEGLHHSHFFGDCALVWGDGSDYDG